MPEFSIAFANDVVQWNNLRQFLNVAKMPSKYHMQDHYIIKFLLE